MTRVIVYTFFILFWSIGSFIFYKYIRPGTFNRKVILHILLFFVIIVSIDFRWTYVAHKFIKTESHSKIIDSFKWDPTHFEFTLENNIKLTVVLGDFDLQYGDSIVKSANTPIFDVYKRDYTGKYFFFKRYDYDVENKH
jgi:hypothetical protein